MNRKDTIIIAVLINAGLLVALFVGAIKTDAPSTPVAVKPQQVREEIALPKPPKLEPVKVAKAEPPKAPAPPVVEKKPAPPPPKKKAEDNLQTVIVQSGDALEKIARRHGVSVDTLISVNGLTSSNLKVGQELKVPSGGAVATKQPRYYVVRAGDSPWTIASKNKIKLSELLSLNNLDNDSAKKLKPGDKLRIE